MRRFDLRGIRGYPQCGGPTGVRLCASSSRSVPSRLSGSYRRTGRCLRPHNPEEEAYGRNGSRVSVGCRTLVGCIALQHQAR
jgi:hypothetical protein